MKKEVLYKYLGTNGTIISPVHLEDIYYVRIIRLTADANKAITKDGIHIKSSCMIPEEEVDQWYEIDSNGQN